MLQQQEEEDRVFYLNRETSPRPNFLGTLFRAYIPDSISFCYATI